MKTDTIDNDMPRAATTTATTVELPVISESVMRLKIYAGDLDLASKIHKQAQPVFRQITVQEILREAVRIGLPVVAKRYKAAAEAATKSEKSATNAT